MEGDLAPVERSAHPRHGERGSFERGKSYHRSRAILDPVRQGMACGRSARARNMGRIR
jgi:hypothetical protein